MEEIASILPRALRQHVRGGNPAILEILIPLWTRVAGKYIGQCSRPVAFEDGKLTLVVMSPAWETQLRGLSEPLTAHINNFFGAQVVKKLRIRPHSVKHQAEWQSAAAATVMGKNIEAHLPKRGRTPARETCEAELASFMKITGELNLPQELASVVEQSFVKYFSRPMRRNPA